MAANSNDMVAFSNNDMNAASNNDMMANDTNTTMADSNYTISNNDMMVGNRPISLTCHRHIITGSPMQNLLHMFWVCIICLVVSMHATTVPLINGAFLFVTQETRRVAEMNKMNKQWISFHCGPCCSGIGQTRASTGVTVEHHHRGMRFWSRAEAITIVQAPPQCIHLHRWESQGKW